METQTCICCSVTKPLSEYYKHPQMANGRLGRCKGCHKKEITRNRNENLDRIRGYDRGRRKWSALTDDEKSTKVERVARRRKAAGPSYQAAHNAVARAIKSCAVVRPDHCHRCLIHGAPQAHHEDYSKPLEIMWLCPICHAQRHVELAKIKLQTKEV